MQLITMQFIIDCHDLIMNNIHHRLKVLFIFDWTYFNCKTTVKSSCDDYVFVIITLTNNNILQID